MVNVKKKQETVQEKVLFWFIIFISTLGVLALIALTLRTLGVI